MGVSINREPYGPLTGTLVPPCISHAVAIIEALLAAEQGVKNITVGYGQCGNLIQDIAAVRTLEELTEEYLAKYGYHDVVVTTVLHQWMGGFPADEAKAFGVISTGALIAALSKATKVIVKSPHEAIGIPTMEANAQGLRCTRQVVSMMTEQTFANTHLDEEMEIIRQETRCIVDQVLRAWHGRYRARRVPRRKGGRSGRSVRALPLQCRSDAAVPRQRRRGAHHEHGQSPVYKGASGLSYGKNRGTRCV